MASSEVDICNSALIHLGAEFINSLSDNSDEARACKQFYADARDALLTQCEWTFANEQQQLARDANDPLFGFNYAYKLPTDPYCLKPLFINDPADDENWKIKGRRLYTDETTVQLEYTARVEDVSKYSPLFVESLGFYLAYKACIAVTGSRTLMADLRVAFEETLIDASSVDSQVGYVDKYDTDRLLRVRA